MKLVVREEMARLDRLASERYGIPSLLLMEAAGRALHAEVARLHREGLVRSLRIFCGKGNNGGDGLVAARHAHNSGIPTTVFFLGDPSGLPAGSDAGINLRIAQAMGIPVECLVEPRDVQRSIDGLGPGTLAVDAVFGTGLRGEVRGLARQWIAGVNHSPAPRLAVDLPSGIDSDDGSVLGAAVQAHMTVTFGLPKRGLAVGDGPRHAGLVVVADISIPRAELEDAAGEDFTGGS